MERIMLNDFLIPTVSALGTGAVAFLFARKKYNAEVSTNELENVEKSIKIYREMVEDLASRIDTLTSNISEIKTENETLKTENKHLKEQVYLLTKQINSYKHD